MRLGVMQPYFFPYAGYFMYIDSVDRFVLYDDVNFIKGGWINRNRICLHNKEQWIRVPMIKASSNKKINEIHLEPSDSWKKDLLTTLRYAYKDAPHYAAVHEVVASAISPQHKTLDEVARASVQGVCNYLNLDCELIPTSAKYQNQELDRVSRLTDICGKEGISTLVQPPGSTSLYSKEEMNSRGVELLFLAPELNPYDRAGCNESRGLSIIDLLANLSVNESKAYLKNYTLV